MTPEDVTQGPNPPPRRRRRLALVVLGLAAVVAVAVGGYAVARGGGSDAPSVASVGSNTGAGTNDTSAGHGGGSDREQMLAYSRCMREHGISDFPDPNSDGGLTLNAGPNSDLAPDNPQFQAADQACKRLQPNGGEAPKADPELRAKMLKYAACMRDHGISDFPDPNENGQLQIEATPGSDLGPDNPQFQSADAACKHFLPGGGKGGSLSQSSEGK
jgi:hypothetical protein